MMATEVQDPNRVDLDHKARIKEDDLNDHQPLTDTRLGVGSEDENGGKVKGGESEGEELP